MKDIILKLHQDGLSYKEIQDQIKCSKSTISYHLNPNQKYSINLRNKKRRNKQHPFQRKLESFFYCKVNTSKIIFNPKFVKQVRDKIANFCSMKIKYNRRKYMKPSFTLEDVINKLGNNPICYLTGQPIDINQPSTYNFDHIIPVSRGGTNDLSNLGLCSRLANQAKSDMTPDELVNFCKLVLNHNGFVIKKEEGEGI